MFFKKTDYLIGQLDRFIAVVDETSRHWVEMASLYSEKRKDETEERRAIIDAREKEADRLKREIEESLYRETLIPESRMDVLDILGVMDNVVDGIKYCSNEMILLNVRFSGETQILFMELVEKSSKAAEYVTQACRYYFRDLMKVDDEIGRVKFYEKECDRKAQRLKELIFAGKEEPAKKLMKKLFIEQCDDIADRCQHAAHRISIAAIKRIV